MKWPRTLTLLRHGRSEYNDLRKKKEALPSFQTFLSIFDREFNHPAVDMDILSGSCPSRTLMDFALQYYLDLQPLMPQCSDFDTPLSELGITQSREVGERLQGILGIPRVTYCSPSLRTTQTLQGVQEGWQELRGVRVLEEDRVREQEHGLRNAFNSDWRLYYVFNPMQYLLYKQEGPYCYRYPNGENKFDVRGRIRDFMNRVVREHAGDDVLVVTHHLSILSFYSVIERWNREKFIAMNKRSRPVNCSVTIFRGHPNLGRHGRLLCDENEYNMKLYDCPTGDDAEAE